MSVTSLSLSVRRDDGGMATAAMKLNASGAAKRHISRPLASKEYDAVCLQANKYQSGNYLKQAIVDYRRWSSRVSQTGAVTFLTGNECKMFVH